MILTSVGTAQQNLLSSPRLAKALEWIASTDLSALEPGRVEIQGDEIFANVMRIQTVSAAEKSFEAHRRYHDIHCVIEGEELIGIAPVEDCTPLGDFDEEGDFCLYEGPECISWAHLRAGDICLTPPADAHKPGCACKESGSLFKVVVKVLV